MVNGVGGMVGPDLTGVGARPSRDPARWPTTEAYIRASIIEPKAYVVDDYGAVMLSADFLHLTAQNVDDVVAYLMTLRQKK